MSEVPQFSPESSEQAMQQTLIDSVRALGPEDLLTQEKATQVKSAYESALDLFTRDKEDELARLNETNQATREYNRHRGKGEPRHKILTKNDVLLGVVWPIQEAARTFLTHPLPGQTFEYEDGEIPEEAEIADTIDWWAQLADQQKRALSYTIGFDLSLGDRYKPPFWKRHKRHVFAKGNLITSPATDDLPETSFYPVLIWTGKTAEDPHGFALSVVPIEGVEKNRRK